MLKTLYTKIESYLWSVKKKNNNKKYNCKINFLIKNVETLNYSYLNY